MTKNSTDDGVHQGSDLQILYEDNHLVAVNKRPGELVQGDRTGDLPLSEAVKNYLKHAYNKPGEVFLGVVHRIDRPTSGVVLFARTSKALARMNKMFAEKETGKIYWAVVGKCPEPAEGTLIHWLVRNPKQNKSYAHALEVKNSKKAVLDYKVLKKLNRYFLLEITLETGRHHQIRSQLSYIGSPVRGDLKYGYDRSNTNGSIHLHARTLSFPHPVQKTALVLHAAPPSDPLWDACI